MILAADYATRLYTLTENFPKPLLKIGNKTILDWLVDDIDSAGLIDEYVVVSIHKYAHHFEAWMGEKPKRISAVVDGRKQLAEHQRVSNNIIMTCLGMKTPNQIVDFYSETA